MGQGNALMFNELTAIKQTLRRLKRERIENSPDGESHEKDPEMLTPEPRIHNGINPDSEHSEGYSRQDYLQFQEEIKRQQELRDENNHTPPQDTVTVDGDGIPEITIGGNSGENEFVPELEDDTPPKHLEDIPEEKFFAPPPKSMEELLDGLFDPPDMTPEERFAPPSDDLKDMEPDNEPRPEGSIENNYPDLEIKPMPYMGEDFDKPEIIEASNKWEDHFSPTVLKGLQLAGTFTAAATDPALASVELESSGPEVSPDISVMKV